VSGARGWIGGGGSPRVFVRLIRGRPPTDAEMNFGLRRDLSPEPRVLDGVEFSAGGAFAPNFRPLMARRLRMKPLPPIPGLPSSVAQGSQLKPLLQRRIPIRVFVFPFVDGPAPMPR
jgi:hypothetical protein